MRIKNQSKTYLKTSVVRFESSECPSRLFDCKRSSVFCCTDGV